MSTARTSSFLALAFLLVLEGSADTSWSPNSGMAQSPVDIRGALARTLPALRFHGHLDVQGKVVLENLGRGAALRLDRKAEVQGGPLLGKYIFHRAVIHWGAEDYDGSEHALNGERFAAEIQLEHFSERFSNISEAREQRDGVAIVSVLVEAGRTENSALRPVTSALARVSAARQQVALGPHALGFLGAALRSDRYLTYLGSITHPPHYESVIWIVFPKPIDVSSEQMVEFRELQSTDPEKLQTEEGSGNVRELQPLQGRSTLFARRIEPEL